MKPPNKTPSWVQRKISLGEFKILMTSPCEQKEGQNVGRALQLQGVGYVAVGERQVMGTVPELACPLIC